VGQLARHRRPRRVGVDPAQLEAEQARAATRLHERADPHLAVAEHDGQVRHVPVQPAPVARRLDRETADDHREVRRRGRRGIRFGAGRRAETDAGADAVIVGDPSAAVDPEVGVEVEVEVVGLEPEVVEEGA